MRIDLSKTTSPRIDLSGQADSIMLTGDYTGARVVIVGASGKKLNFISAAIRTTHPEDALVFDGDLKDCTISASDTILHAGGITFWGGLESVVAEGFNIVTPHTGIRATKTKYRNVVVRKNRITGASHEGIYMGQSTASSTPSDGIEISDNSILLTGWDGIQVGDWKNAKIFGNTVIRSGEARKWGQWGAITINPGSLAFVWDNDLQDCYKGLEVNDARCYTDNPDKK